ncbi:anti-sigma factor antagonist [Nocardia sp. AG03]|uniref:anti-sigma factor antagonist n=1 Tax=Nocardia sp. AG03 TaxID=3025312 RepID=UPI0024185C1E|nr:anti-sigma factor antagonist [Nocardia sp. AG03]
MRPRLHRVTPFPPAVGESADLCLRLQAELELRPQAVLLHVHGEADAYTLSRWRRILDAALAEATTGYLVVDLSDTEFLGCRPILDLADRAQQALTRGIRVAIYNPVPGVVNRIIDVAGLSTWLPIHTSLPEALTTHLPLAPGA